MHESDKCALCQEHETLGSADICVICQNDQQHAAEAQSRNFAASDSPEDWDEEHRQAQESGEVFEGDEYAF